MDDQKLRREAVRESIKKLCQLGELLGSMSASGSRAIRVEVATGLVSDPGGGAALVSRAPVSDLLQARRAWSTLAAGGPGQSAVAEVAAASALCGLPAPESARAYAGSWVTLELPRSVDFERAWGRKGPRVKAPTA